MNEPKRSTRLKAKAAKELPIEPPKPQKKTPSETATPKKSEPTVNTELEPPTEKKVKKQEGLLSPNVYARKTNIPPSKLLEFIRQIGSDPDSL